MTMLPARRGLRVVGDVHGDVAGFRAALATDNFVIQLGDLVDGGPDSAGALRLALDMQDQGRGLFLLGNHDHKLGRVLAGHAVTVGPELAATLDGLDTGLRARTLHAISAAPLWLRAGRIVFVHGGFHTAMIDQPAPRGLMRRADGPMARALYGEPTGRTQPDGFPERSLAWVDRIPAGFTVYCGHDRRSRDGRPWVCPGSAGGTAVFVDTGAGKGGHLSWIDLPPPAN